MVICMAAEKNLEWSYINIYSLYVVSLTPYNGLTWFSLFFILPIHLYVKKPLWTVSYSEASTAELAVIYRQCNYVKLLECPLEAVSFRFDRTLPQSIQAGHWHRLHTSVCPQQRSKGGENEQFSQPISTPGCAELRINEGPPGGLVLLRTAGRDSPPKLNWTDTVKWPVILPAIEWKVLRLGFIGLSRWTLCKNDPPDWWLDARQRHELWLDKPAPFMLKKQSHRFHFSLFINNCPFLGDFVF